MKRSHNYESSKFHEVNLDNKLTYFEVAGAVGTDPLEIGGTRLHLCQICIVEPY